MKTSKMKFRMTASLAAFGVLAAASNVFAAGTALIPDKEYDKYQIVSFTDTQGQKFRVCVSADEEEENFNLRFDYYDMTADLDVETLSNGNYHITNGEFFQTSGQAVVEEAVKEGRWISLQ